MYQQPTNRLIGQKLHGILCNLCNGAGSIFILVRTGANPSQPNPHVDTVRGGQQDHLGANYRM